MDRDRLHNGDPAAVAEGSTAELVATTWREETAADEADASLRRALDATLCLVSRDRDSRHYPALLEEAIRSFSGERAFLFAFAATAADEPEPGPCLASMDLDGDPIPQPERKVARSLLLKTGSSRTPFFRAVSEDDGDGSRLGSILALPAVSRGQCFAVLVVENRFRDLKVEARTLRALQLACRCLAASLDLQQTAHENDCLWKDLTRLRDEAASGSQVRVPAAPKRRPRHGGEQARQGLKGDYSMIVGSSPKMLEIFQVIDRISGSNAPVLINGESGTGKELAAMAVHNNSPRTGKTFVSENCGAITETLLESELFGYVKGAFTGANKDHKGLFELAVGGTLFLDEVGDMSPSMQKKLLRVLQEGVIRRVGAKDFTPVDVRIISATNKDLMAECRAGNFREDLYYRLNVINLRLPPLRERREDIPLIVDFFLEELGKDGATKRLDAGAMKKLAQHSWPGNIRELQNEVRKLHALSDGSVIQAKDLSEHLWHEDDGDLDAHSWPVEFSRMTLKEATEQLERQMIRNALNECGGNKSQVAKVLEIPKTSLYNKINKYSL